MSDQKATEVTRREFVGGALGAVVAAGTVLNSAGQTTRPPNILFILADDMGWGDLSCYGRPDYTTPNIDRLATEGMLFTNAYSAAPVCTPTRVGWITGRYPARLPIGLEEPIRDRSQLGERIKIIGIPHDHPTLPSLIKRAGYSTALVGKWHLGYLPEFGPLHSGFDEFFGIMSGAGDYFTHKDGTGEPDLFEGEVPVDRVGYITDLLTQKAVDYLTRSHKVPFYLSLHYTAPHWPWEGPADIDVSKTLKAGPVGFASGGSLKTYGEIVTSMDRGIGRVLAKLRSSGLDRKTIVIFTSDNGGERFSYNWPFTGAKFDLHEGGIRVPAIVRWPGITKAGTRNDQTVTTLDWTATMIAAAGGEADARYPFDGIDMTKVLAGQLAPFDRALFWRTHKQGAIRSGRWKYIRDGQKEFLHDIVADEREQANFAESGAQKLAEMRAEFNKWEAGMVSYPVAQR
jgi:arylsulfatase A-like enzyme